MKVHCLLLSVLFLTIIVSGCAEQKGNYTKEGKEYGKTEGSFRGRWWNYYERGRSFSDGRFYTEAIDDFNKAIKGRDKDQWRARTYGMHFTDYFPHRELGIIFFQQERFIEAIRELETSIEGAASSKAHFFLNRARAEKLIKDGDDMSDPVVRLESGPNGNVTNSFSRIVKGVALDDTYIAAIQVGGKDVPIELAQKQKSFAVEIQLDEGKNSIPVIVTDLVGKSTRTTLTIFCDRRGPLVEIVKVQTQGDTRVVRGVVSDPGGLVSLSINGRQQRITDTFSEHVFTISQPSQEKITLVATDNAGNITKATIESENGDGEDGPAMPKMASLFASAHFSPLQPWEASRTIARPFISANTVLTDKEPPFITLKDLSTAQETFEEYVLLEGKVVDYSPIHSVSVNGEPIFTKNGAKLYFSQLKKLDEGYNQFLVAATDIHGNRRDINITIKRKVEKIRQIGSRMSVAVLPFDHKGEESPISELVHDQMINSFLEQKRFSVVERAKMEAVLQELELSSTVLVNPDKAADLGRIISANVMLAGTVIESPDSIEIIGRLIDTETATILASNDVFGTEKSFSSLANLLDSLAFKFKRDFPILEGTLIEIRKNEVIIDIGAEKRIKRNQHLICFRDGAVIKNPVTGKTLGSEPEILSELTVQEVFEGFSKANLTKQKGELKAYDKVIAR